MFKDQLVWVKNLSPAAVILAEGYHSSAPVISFLITIQPSVCTSYSLSRNAEGNINRLTLFIWSYQRIWCSQQRKPLIPVWSILPQVVILSDVSMAMCIILCIYQSHVWLLCSLRMEWNRAGFFYQLFFTPCVPKLCSFCCRGGAPVPR